MNWLGKQLPDLYDEELVRTQERLLVAMAHVVPECFVFVSSIRLCLPVCPVLSDTSVRHPMPAPWGASNAAFFLALVAAGSSGVGRIDGHYMISTSPSMSMSMSMGR